MNVAVLSIVASALTAIVISVIGVLASRKKDDAQANALTSTEWKKLYDEMCRRIEKLEKKIDEQAELLAQQSRRISRQDSEIMKQGHELDIAKDYIQYLWLGIVSLTNQLQDEGMEPVFKPQRNFRGDNDFDPDEWRWIGDRNK